jgi:hypothetical protein
MNSWLRIAFRVTARGEKATAKEGSFAQRTAEMTEEGRRGRLGEGMGKAVSHRGLQR